MSDDRPTSVLFICLGNICRSPMAEAVFLQILENKGQKTKWKIDSAAIGNWHVGRGPDPRTMKTLKKNNLANYRHTVRQVTREDFNDFEYIVGMDHENISDLNDIKPKNSKAKIIMFGDYDTQRSKEIIEDPYYSDDIGAFEEAYIKIKRCCEGFYESLTNTTHQNT